MQCYGFYINLLQRATESSRLVLVSVLSTSRIRSFGKIRDANSAQDVRDQILKDAAAFLDEVKLKTSEN